MQENKFELQRNLTREAIKTEWKLSKADEPQDSFSYQNSLVSNEATTSLHNYKNSKWFCKFFDKKANI